MAASTIDNNFSTTPNMKGNHDLTMSERAIWGILKLSANKSKPKYFGKKENVKLNDFEQLRSTDIFDFDIGVKMNQNVYNWQAQAVAKQE